MALFSCPGCSTKLQIADGQMGLPVKCPRCGRVTQTTAIRAGARPPVASPSKKTGGAGRGIVVAAVLLLFFGGLVLIGGAAAVWCFSQTGDSTPQAKTEEPPRPQQQDPQPSSPLQPPTPADAGLPRERRVPPDERPAVDPVHPPVPPDARPNPPPPQPVVNPTDKPPKNDVEPPQDLAQARTNLRGQDAAARKAACAAIGRLGPAAKEAIPDLLQAMHDDDAGVRLAAKAALGTVGLLGKPQRDIIVASLGDKEVEVRRYALLSLRATDCDDTGTFAAVARLLTDADLALRKDAVALMPRFARTARADTIGALIPVLGDASLRAAALAQLRKLSPMQADDLPVLRKALKDGPDEGRVFAASQLGQLGSKAKKCTADLVAELGQARGELRHEILVALLAIDPNDLNSKTALQAALADEDPGIRQRAVLALAENDDASYVLPQLINVLKDKNPDVRVAVLNVLESVDSDRKQVAGAAARVLKDPDATVRVAALALLKTTGAEAKTVLAEITEALDDATPDVKTNAALVIGSLGKEGKDAVPELRRLLTNSDAKVRGAAMWALGRIGADAKPAVPDLIGLLKEPDEARRPPIVNALAGIGKAAVPQLTDALSHRDPWVRLGAVQALAKIGPDAAGAIGTMSGRFQKDPAPLIRAAAKDALKAIQSKTPVAFVYPKSPPLLHPTPRIILATGEKPEAATEEKVQTPLDMMIAALQSKSPAQRLTAITKLGELGPEARPAVRPLCDLVLRSVGSEREAVLQTLERIDRKLYRAVVPLIVDRNSSVHQEALGKLKELKMDGHDALPIVLAFSRTQTEEAMLTAVMETLAEIAPAEPEVIQFVARFASDPASMASLQALDYLATWGKNNLAARRLAVQIVQRRFPTGREEPEAVPAAVAVVNTIPKIGPDARFLVPRLKRLKLASEAQIREAATAAVDKLERQ